VRYKVLRGCLLRAISFLYNVALNHVFIKLNHITDNRKFLMPFEYFEYLQEMLKRNISPNNNIEFKALSTIIFYKILNINF